MSLASLCKRFSADRTGVVAVIFAFSLVPLVIAVGAGVDYSRASSLRSDLQAAVDGAALAVGRVAIETGRTDNTAQARQVFDAGFQRTDGTSVSRFNVTQDPTRIVVDADASIPLVFAGILNRESITVNAKAVVPLERIRVEVALVLDNTGSMNAANKLTYLKEAAKILIDKLDNASVVNFEALVAVVPFTTQIRLPNVSLPQPPPGYTYDPVQTLPGVRINHPNDAAETRLKVTFPWNGCLVDRNQPNDADGYDADGKPLSRNVPASLLPAANCDALISPLMPLTDNLPAVREHIRLMVAAGDTNTGIGLASGLAVLTPNIGELPTGAQPAGRLVKKHLIFLTDGENTVNRWHNAHVNPSTRSQIDQRTVEMCAEIKRSKLGIVVHTIHLVDGNATLLQNCASTPANYRYVSQAIDLTGVFDQIANEIISLRLGY